MFCNLLNRRLRGVCFYIWGNGFVGNVLLKIWIRFFVQYKIGFQTHPILYQSASLAKHLEIGRVDSKSFKYGKFIWRIFSQQINWFVSYWGF